MLSADQSSRFVATLLLSILVLSGCGEKPAAPPPAMPEVGVMTLAPQAVATSMELPGRITAVRMAQIRPQVGGIIKQRLFTEGSEVTAGAPLYQIDPALFKAALARTRGELARAEAQLATARLKEQRLKPLLQRKLVSQQDYDVADADLRSARADVEVAKAAVQTATIDLGYTNITAPISGRIGKSIVTEGALVEAEQEEPLAVIQQLDPIYVDLTQSSNELMRLRRQLASGELRQTATGQGVVRLTLDDGSEYGHPGTLEFSEVTVEQSTGSVTLRATFANAERFLLPGMFVRARLQEGVRDNVILAPQLAITRNHSGQAVALVVNAEDKVEQRVLKTDRAIGDQWLVADGLKAGDRLIVEGLQKARPGTQVKPVPSSLGAISAPTTTGDAKAN
ncbi:MAG: efflux RND transporter periplasmic adaptor subunit [Porticoccaceae bacterium]